MRIPSFIGGTDEQRSTNLSDDKLINLYPTTNNDGSIAAFYKVDGLKSEGTLSGVPTGAYKASNGRAFYTSGTTLYELTVPGGIYTSTSRGTITTGTNYEFSDNGLEMIMVNGTDGWLFTFSTNALVKLTVLTGNFTVQTATGVEVDATLTKVAHGLIAGDAVILTTTGSLPTYLLPNTTYYVLTSGLTADTFKVALTAGGTAIKIIQTGSSECIIKNTITAGPCTVTAASPAVLTKIGHNLSIGDRVSLSYSDGGSLPSGWPLGLFGVSAYTYVIAAGFTVDSVQLSATAQDINGVDGTPVNTTTTGTNLILGVSSNGKIKPLNGVDINFGDEISFATTGSLPTGLSVGTKYFAAGDFGLLISPSSISNLILSCYSNTLIAGSKVKFFSKTFLPSGIVIGKDYFLISSGDVLQYYFISETLNGTPLARSTSASCIVFQTDTFSLATTLDYCYTSGRVIISGTQSGTHSYFKEESIAFGTHTYTTGGSGFPNGAKQVKYMNGRFIAAESNTQNFYVSEVLDGRTWDAINVQTVDSNPDYVTGIEVSHNELVVFCENSGETYYDSGTTPTPFVRNVTGIFNVGCKAPYTIKEIGGSIMFMGNTTSGNGIIYRMQGLTPVRVSTYSIEYQIQQMSDISDARALVYQKDGHHFYVLTFPTGNKTFVFDASTSLWHERGRVDVEYAITIGTPYAVGENPRGVAFESSTNSIWLTSYNLNTVTKLSASNGALIGTYAVGENPHGVAFDSSTNSIWLTNVGSNTVTKLSASNGALIGTYGVGIGPYGVAFDTLTNSIWVTNYYSNTVVKLSASNGGVLGTYAVGTGPYGVAFDTLTNSIWVANASSSNVTKLSALNGALIGTYAVGTGPFSVAFDTLSNSIWAANYNSNTVTRLRASNGALIGTYAVGTGPRSVAFDTLTNSIWVANYQSNDVTKFTISEPNIFTLESVKWPVNKYLYYNNKHLITNDTTTLFSIDSSTYQDGTNPIRIVRSFRAPASDMKRVAHHTIQVACEVGIGSGTEPVIALRWSDDAGNTWSTPIEKGLGVAGEHAKRVMFRRLGATKGIPRIYELSCVEDVKITLLDCYLE